MAACLCPENSLVTIPRRTLLASAGGALTLPLLDAHAAQEPPPPLRLLVVGNPFGMHPDFFFPKKYGPRVLLPTTLRSLDWLQGRMTILGHTDHGMKSGHGREKSFLSGVLPENSSGFPEKNISIDQVVARRAGSRVRFASVHAGLESGIRMSWNANGVELKPITDPHKLFDHLFLNLSEQQKRVRRELIERNGSILDAVRGQFAALKRRAGKVDQQRLGQYADSVRTLERNLAERKQWLGRDKPKFDLSPYFSGSAASVARRYHAIFDMIAYAFQTDLTRVATIAFPSVIRYTEVDGVTRSYHACTHNGKKEDVVSELVAIESFQIEQLARCLRKLDAIREPNSDGTLLDHTVVLFGSGMGYGGTHSNRNLPILVAGGGLKHRGHVDTRDGSGNNMPLCNLYLTLLRRFGIERDHFNTSTGAFALDHA